MSTMSTMSTKLRLFPLLLLLLTGCKVGPNYCVPQFDLPETFMEAPCASASDENFTQWWTAFNDPYLNDLLERASQQNLDYKIALERIFQARAAYQVQFAQIFPEIDAEGMAMRFRISNNVPGIAQISKGGFPLTQSFYQAELAALWQLDLFGKFRRSAEASYDLWEATAEEMRGVRITILSEVARAYVALCAYRKKLHVLQEIVTLDEELMHLAESRFKKGLADKLEVENTSATFESDRSQLFTVETGMKKEIYSLALLLGETPDCFLANLQIAEEVPYAEGKIPVGLPSDLLRRRPDIRQAERQLASATEQIGVAVADLFPSFSLTGTSGSLTSVPIQASNVGYSSSSLDKLFTSSSSIWGVGIYMNAPILDFGKREATVDLRQAQRDESYYAYKKTIIAALTETESALHAYFNEEKREQSLEKQAEANHRNFMLIKSQVENGIADTRRLSAAKKQWLNSFTLLIDSREALASDLIAVYNALGGDW